MADTTQREVAKAVADATALRATADKKFVDLARRVALLGEPVDAAEIERIASAAHRPIQDFRSLVSQFEHRKRLKERLARRGEIQQLVHSTEAEVVKENEQLERAVQKHQAACAPLQRRLDELKKELGELGGLEYSLADSCPDGRIRARWKRLIADDARQVQCDEAYRAAIDY